MNLIILAGGKSSRLGKDKAFVKFEGVPIIERILSVLGTLFGKCLIVTNTPEKYADLGCRVVTDVYQGVGPLGGLHAGLTASDSERNLVTACDMPLINQELVKYLINVKGQDAVVPVVKGFPEPLLAVYSKKCLPAIDKMIRGGQYKISRLYDKVATKFIDEKELREIDPELLSFCNINTLNALKTHEK
ncbi:molybdenum cofactor guanylyltransferase [Candidatus Saganbacteria bacterium]|nr:molybdenum cofactor guanylyltransferase [Candidatus Saganbacteria bacterium]